MAQWYNDDGLKVDFNSVNKSDLSNEAAQRDEAGKLKTIVVEFDYTDVDANDFYTTDRDNDGTNDGWSGQDECIPAGAEVTEVKLEIGTAFATCTALTIGLKQQDGTEIDNDGLGNATALAVANLAEGAVLTPTKANAALVRGGSIGANDGYIYVVETGTSATAGTAVLYVTYKMPA